MFTGIIEETGVVKSLKTGIESAVILIGATKILGDLKPGDSVNTNGACLTVVSIGKNEFSVDVMAETLRRTNPGQLKPGTYVNLERAVRLNDRLGGHLVSGHIDGTAVITERKPGDNALWLTFKASPEILKYIIEKGSVAIDGISLTVADVHSTDFSVSLIPFTMKDTTLATKKVGELVNIECDLIGKYIERFLTFGKNIKETRLDAGFLKEHGYL